MEFKPKDWVLARDDEKETWKLDIFSHFADGLTFPYRCVGSYYSECIPFEGNEALLGTKDEPKEKKTGEWKVGDKVEVRYCGDDKWYTGTIIEIDPEHTSFVSGEEYPYKVAASCFHDSFKSSRWCSREQLREPVEKPEEEEFKYGDRVECNIGGRWVDAIFLYNDGSDSAPYKIASKMFGDIYWVEKKDVRRA